VCGRGPLENAPAEMGEPFDELALLGDLRQVLDLGALQHGDGLVIAGDRDVEEALEDGALVLEVRVHRFDRDVGRVRDRLHGRALVANVGEQPSGFVDDPPAGVFRLPAASPRLI
jgi:hypothetical protein